MRTMMATCDAPSSMASFSSRVSSLRQPCHSVGQSEKDSSSLATLEQRPSYHHPPSPSLLVADNSRTASVHRTVRNMDSSHLSTSTVAWRPLDKSHLEKAPLRIGIGVARDADENGEDWAIAFGAVGKCAMVHHRRRRLDSAYTVLSVSHRTVESSRPASSGRDGRSLGVSRARCKIGTAPGDHEGEDGDCGGGEAATNEPVTPIGCSTRS